MRILQITENFPPNHLGGAEISCKLISEQLEKRGHEIHVLTNYCKKQCDKKSNIIYFKNKSYWGCNDSKDLLDDYAELKKIAKEIKPDVIHLHLYENYLHGTMFLARDFPLVYTAHNYTFLLPNYLKINYFFKNLKDFFSIKFLIFFKHLILLDRNYINKVISENLPLIKKIIIPSEFAKHKFEYFKFNNLKLIYNGILNSYPKNAAKNNPDEILYFGRIEKEKGIKYLIKSIKQLMILHEDIKLTLVGEGNYLNTIKRIIKKNNIEDRVKIIKKQDEINLSEYNGIVIYPSIWDENCSMSILEALSAGKIVICTARGGNPELVKDLFNGLIINERDYNAITKKILILKKYTGLRKYLSYNAKNMYNEKFSIDYQVNQLEQTYREIL